MRSIAVMNQKGGVGKTTTAVNLSVALADLGQRVGLIDLDSQAHATLHLGAVPREGLPTSYDVLMGQASFEQARRVLSPNLWVIPAHRDLAAVELELAGQTGRERMLREALTQDPLETDYVLVDCPPSLGVLTLNALAAVDEVLLPLQPHFLALHGVSQLLNTMDAVAQRWNPRLRLTGVVFCMYDTGTRLAAEVAHDMTAFFNRDRERRSVWSRATIFSTRVRRNIRLAEAPSFGQSIFQYAPTCHGAEDYRRLAEELMGASAMQLPANAPAA